MSLENRHKIMKIINEANKQGARILSCCKTVGLSTRTLQRWKKEPLKSDQRKGPGVWQHKLTADEKSHMIAIANSPAYRDLNPNQFVPLLADKGIYIASERSFYRVLKEKKLLRHRGKSSPKKNKKPLHLLATRPNQVWSWDITYLKSNIRGEYFYLYLVMDIFSRAIIGWKVYDEQTSQKSSILIKECCSREKVNKGELSLHSDNGGPMKGATMLSTLQKLGVIPSFNRPSVSSDNPFSESLFKTLKYVPSYPDKAFKSLEDARIWVEKFVHWYNYQHLHSEISFTKPMDRHLGKDVEVLKRRKEVYEKAKKNNPIRWKKQTRNWEKIQKVSLNPEKIVKDYQKVA